MGDSTEGTSFDLKPVDGSDQPKAANCGGIVVSEGSVFIDFGFIDPKLLVELSDAVKAGRVPGPPEKLEGRLVARISLTPEGLMGFHSQLDKFVKRLQKPDTEQQ